MAGPSRTNGDTTFSVQKTHAGRTAIAFHVVVQNYIALECEVCCAVNFALRV